MGRYWTLFLGRRTSIKETDISVGVPTGRSETEGAQRLEVQIYTALLDLLDLTTRITELVDRKDVSRKTDVSDHLAAAALGQELTAWYRRLPHELKWASNNLQSAPPSFYLFQ